MNTERCGSLIFELHLTDHVTSSLLQLHWLPVRWRIQFKLCAIAYSIFTMDTCSDLRRRRTTSVELSFVPNAQPALHTFVILSIPSISESCLKLNF